MKLVAATALELVDLMVSGKLITEQQKEQLASEIQSGKHPNLEEFLIQSGCVSKGELASIVLAHKLISENRIDHAKAAVAIFDERSVSLKMEESLRLRGWITEADVKAAEESLR